MYSMLIQVSFSANANTNAQSYHWYTNWRINMDPRVITFHYTLTAPNGQILDTSSGKEPLSFIEGLGHIIPGLEDHLVDMKVKEQKVVEVPAKDAYGTRDENLVITVNKEESFGDLDVAVGNQYQLENDNNMQAIFTVIDLQNDEVTLDGNHPLAGMDLKFEVELVEVRNATADELSHGHVHGEGCNH